MGSKSKSSSSTTTSNQDNRVGASDEAIAVGAGASVTIDAESPEVYTLLNEFLAETGSALDKAIELAGTARASESAAVASVIDVADKSRGFSADALKMLAPVAIVAAVAWGVRGLK